MLTFVLCVCCLTRSASFYVSRSYVLFPATAAPGEVTREVSVGPKFLADAFLSKCCAGFPDEVPSVKCPTCVAISIGLRALPAPNTPGTFSDAFPLGIQLRLLRGDRGIIFTSSFSRSSN